MHALWDVENKIQEDYNLARSLNISLFSDEQCRGRKANNNMEMMNHSFVY